MLRVPVSSKSPCAMDYSGSFGKKMQITFKEASEADNSVNPFFSPT